ncbi:MAG: RnfABCDGE type electron transport complex subunit B [Candidatus Omnitrophota bacterium]
MGNLILISILIMAGLGAILGIGLIFAYRKLKVEEDERLKQILETLPGLNCGGCGYASCEDFAKKLLEGEAPIDACKVGGEKIAKELEKYVEKGDSAQKDSKKVRLKCNVVEGRKVRTAQYYGIKKCISANALNSSGFACFDGCLGLGDCVGVCPVSAITMVEGRPEVNLKKCIGCGKCVGACPRNLFDLTVLKEKTNEIVIVGCNCTQKGAVVMKMCKSGCIACGKCVKTCPVEAITLTNNLAYIDPQKCTTCGKCVEVCPTKAIYSNPE